MNELVPKSKAAKLYWWAIFVYFSLLSFNCLATSIIASLVGAKWEMLSGQERFLIFMSVVANWTGLVLAFVRTSMGRLVSGRPPIETGDTGRLARAQE